MFSSNQGAPRPPPCGFSRWDREALNACFFHSHILRAVSRELFGGGAGVIMCRVSRLCACVLVLVAGGGERNVQQWFGRTPPPCGFTDWDHEALNALLLPLTHAHLTSRR